jgi:hypothetical protein
MARPLRPFPHRIGDHADAGGDGGPDREDTQTKEPSMNLTLAQLAPVACAAFVAAAMIRLGAAKKMLVIRQPNRCAACGVEQSDCRCAL